MRLRHVVAPLRGEVGLLEASADEVARTVFESAPVQEGLAGLLGMQGPVTPPDLREHLWENARLRRSVNALMHPLILQTLKELNADAIEIPLLIETCFQGYFRQVWVVTCGLEEQRKRLLDRFGPKEDLAAILASQVPTEVKCTFADVIVRTNRPPDDVHRFIKAVARRTRR